MYKIFSILLILIGFSSTLALDQNGTLVGTAILIEAKSGAIIKEAAEVEIKLNFNKEVKVIKTDAKGDFILALPVGKYCLSSATDKNGKALKLSPNQLRCFKIKSNRDTRFDLMLLQE